MNRESLGKLISENNVNEHKGSLFGEVPDNIT